MSHSGGDADGEEGCTCEEAEGIREISVLATQFCCQLKLLYKIRSIKKIFKKKLLSETMNV